MSLASAPAAAVSPTTAPSSFLARLRELASIEGYSNEAQAIRRDIRASLAPVLLQRMAAHRHLFTPLWVDPKGRGGSYGDDYVALDAATDKLHSCHEFGSYFKADVERLRPGSAVASLFPVVFPLRFLADDGEAVMRADVLAILDERRSELDYARAALAAVEAEVLARLNQLQPVQA